MEKEISGVQLNEMPRYDIRVEIQNVKLFWDIEKTNIIQRFLFRLLGIKISKYKKENNNGIRNRR